MILKTIKYELQNILSGASGSSHDAVIQAISHHLKRSERTSPTAEEKHKNKHQETTKLIKYAHTHKVRRTNWIVKCKLIRFFISIPKSFGKIFDKLPLAYQKLLNRWLTNSKSALIPCKAALRRKKAVPIVMISTARFFNGWRYPLPTAAPGCGSF